MPKIYVEYNMHYNTECSVVWSLFLRPAFNGLDIILNSLQIHHLPLYAFNFMSDHNVLETADDF
jgi:hypothetical protein